MLAQKNIAFGKRCCIADTPKQSKRLLNLLRRVTYIRCIHMSLKALKALKTISINWQLVDLLIVKLIESLPWRSWQCTFERSSLPLPLHRKLRCMKNYPTSKTFKTKPNPYRNLTINKRCMMQKRCIYICDHVYIYIYIYICVRLCACTAHVVNYLKHFKTIIPYIHV